MEEKSSRSNRKRPFFEDEESSKPPVQKRVRFPKGKKLKPGDEVAVAGNSNAEDASKELKDPRLAAKERAKRRNQITAELFSEEGEGVLRDVTAAEVTYQANENFEDDGIQIEPFNLNKEREEGYFDAEGNFVEYVNENEIKDAWLDSIEANPKYSGGGSTVTSYLQNEDDDENENEDAIHDLSSEETFTIKRRIANVLEPGETVLQALRRLKGTSNNRKEKMSVETKCVFDQLTEDANKLIEHGEYNVYHEKQEVFQREAEGYDMLARARGKETSLSVDPENSNFNVGKDFFDVGIGSSTVSDSAAGTSMLDVTAASSGADAYDMFAEEDEHDTANISSNGSNLASGPNSDAINQSSSVGALQNNYVHDESSDYVYDESSGYYYSSSLGYYYDPSTRLYCSAATGQWYSFNEDTGTYDEIRDASSNVN